MSIGPNTSDIVGAALWYPPGKKAFATYVAIIRAPLIPLTLRAISSEEERAAGWNEFMETIPEKLRDWWLNEVCEFAFLILHKSHDLVCPSFHQLWFNCLRMRLVQNTCLIHGICIFLALRKTTKARATEEHFMNLSRNRHVYDIFNQMMRTYTDAWSRSGQSRRITYGVGNNDRTGC